MTRSMRLVPAAGAIGAIGAIGVVGARGTIGAIGAMAVIGMAGAITLGVMVPAGATAPVAAGGGFRIEVSGEGSVPVRADTMYVCAAIDLSTVRPADGRAPAKAALERLDGLISRSGAAVREVKVSDARPETAAVPVTVTVRPLRRADRLLTVLLGARSWLRLRGVSYDRADWTRERDQAVRAALADARRQARRRAWNLGRRLGTAVSVRIEMVDPIPAMLLPEEEIVASGGRPRPPRGAAHATVHVTYTVR